MTSAAPRRSAEVVPTLVVDAVVGAVLAGPISAAVINVVAVTPEQTQN